MVKSLHIKNFQSHADSYFEFVPGMNVLRGDTHSGKSAVLRALRKLLRNDISGIYFFKGQKKECLIILTGEKGSAKRILERNKKSLTVNDLELSDGRKFSALGTGLPPQELNEFLNVSPPIEIANFQQDFNFQKQKEGNFLVDNRVGNQIITPSLRAKFFDYLSGIGVFNLCIQEVNRRVQANSKEQTICESNIKTLEKEIEEYYYLSTLEAILEFMQEVEESNEKLEELETIKGNIAEINRERKEIAEELAPLSEFVGLSGEVDNILQVLELVESINNLDEEIHSLREKWVALDSLDLLEDDIVKLFGVIRVMEIDQEAEDLTYLWEEQEIRIKELETRKQEIITELGYCPVCGAIKEK